MRIPLLTAALVALTLVAPTAAGASPLAGGSPALKQDLRSPDARDAAQDIARLRAGNPRTAELPGPVARARAQEQYYKSYGVPTPAATAADDDSPWLTIGLGIGLTVLVAGAVAFAVRTRRRAPRVGVA